MSAIRFAKITAVENSKKKPLQERKVLDADRMHRQQTQATRRWTRS